MNLYYLKRQGPILIRRIYNQYQKEADNESYIFNPTFSRALQIMQPGLIELQISGTASIDKNGNTVYPGDAYNQIKTALKMVNNLLRQADLEFKDICFATCIFKYKSDYVFFPQVLEELGYSEFPFISIQGNLCRDDLLFEIDGVAMREL